MPWFVAYHILYLVCAMFVWPCGIFFGNLICFCDHVVCFSKTIENFKLRYLKVRNDRNENQIHVTFRLMWHCGTPNSWSMAPHTKQSFGFVLAHSSTKCYWNRNTVSQTWFGGSKYEISSTYGSQDFYWFVLYANRGLS